MTFVPLLPITLTCATDLRFVDLIQVVGAELLKHMSFTQEDGERLWLAIQEGIVNAMRHGNKLDKRKPVTVTFFPSPGSLRIQIEDRGSGFDLDAIPDPNLPENLLKPCGRGVHCMKRAMDSVSLAPVEGGGSVLTLVKQRKREEPAPTDQLPR